MTQINIATDIPPSIDTLEKLVMWGIMGLRRCNPTLSILERANAEPENAAQTAVIQASDDSIRFVGRVSLEMSQDYAEDNAVKLWGKALKLSDVDLPDQYKQD